MQYDSRTPFTESYKAVSLKQPEADLIAGGELDHILLNKGTEYRGEVLVVSRPSKCRERSGMMLCKADLIDCKETEGGWLWKFRNPRRVIELPCQKAGMRGILWDCHYTRGEVMEYPKSNLRPFLKYFKEKGK